MKRKTRVYIDVRIYAEQKDLEHTHEIRYTLTPNSGLDLESLSHKMNFRACQASQLEIIPDIVLIISPTDYGCPVMTLVWQGSCPGKGCY